MEEIKNHITLVYAYYENGKMLDRHLEEWMRYRHKEKFSVIIVDDCSHRDPAKDHFQGIDIGFPVSLYRITTDIPWNQNGARNLAMTFATDWCLITDMDHLLSVKNAGRLIQQPLDKKHHYKPQRRLDEGSKHHQHPNTYVLHRDLYWDAGGYDEAFCGYYGSDSTFRRQLKKISTCIDFENIHTNLYSREVIPDASTTKFGRKDSKYHVSNSEELSRRRREHTPPIEPLNFDWHRVL